MNYQLPNQQERRAAMAKFRADSLAIYTKQLQTMKLKPADRKHMESIVATIKAAQLKFGETK